MQVFLAWRRIVVCNSAAGTQLIGRSPQLVPCLWHLALCHSPGRFVCDVGAFAASCMAVQSHQGVRPARDLHAECYSRNDPARIAGQHPLPQTDAVCNNICMPFLCTSLHLTFKSSVAAHCCHALLQVQQENEQPMWLGRCLTRLRHDEPPLLVQNACVEIPSPSINGAKWSC